MIANNTGLVKAVIIGLVCFIHNQCRASIISKTDTTVAWDYCTKAKTLSDSAVYDSSFYYYTQACNIYKKNKIHTKYIRTRQLAFIELRETGKYQDAEVYASENLQYAKRKLKNNSKLLGNCYNNMGNAFGDLEQSDTAMYYFRKALHIWELDSAENSENIAHVYNSIGVMFSNKGMYDSARVYMEESLRRNLRLYGEEDIRIDNNYNSLGVLNYYIGDFEESARYFTKLIDIRKKVLGTEHPDVASAYNNLGAVYEEMNLFDKTIECHETALRIRTEKLGENHPNVALSNNNLGNAMMSVGRYQDALFYHRKALAIRNRIYDKPHPDMSMSYTNLGVLFRDMAIFDSSLYYFTRALNVDKKTIGENHPQIASSYNNMGVIYSAMGEWDSALIYFTQALNIRLATLPENHPAIAGSYGNIGAVYKFRGDYSKALQYYKRSLAINQKCYGEKNLGVAGDYNNMGEIFQKKQDYTKALEYYTKSLDLKISLLGNEHIDISHAYNNIATVYDDMGEYEEAYKNYMTCLDIKKKTFGDSHISLATTFNNIAMNLTDQGRTLEALDIQYRAVKIQEENLPQKHPEFASGYQCLADIFMLQKNYSEAIRYYHKALLSDLRNYNDSDVYQSPALHGILDEHTFLEILASKADAFYSLYQYKSKDLADLKAAFDHYQNALQLLDKVRLQFLSEESKITIFEDFHSVYDKAIHVSLLLSEKLGDPFYKEYAFRCAESSKTVLLSELLNNIKAMDFGDVPDSLIREEKALKGKINYFKTLLSEQLINEEITESEIAQLEKNVFDLEEKYNRLIDRLDKENPTYKELKFNTAIITPAEIQDQMDANSVLVEYYLGDSNLYAFVFRKDAFKIIDTPIDSSFSKNIEQYLASIRKNRTQDFCSLNKQLNSILIEPVRYLLDDKEKIVFIPDKALLYIPFETLADNITGSELHPDFREINYLIKKHAVSYQYTAQLWMNSMSRDFENDLLVSASNSRFIGFAPVFSSDTSRGYILASIPENSDSTLIALRSEIMRGDQVNELPYSEQEIESIISLFRDHNMQAEGYFHNMATESSFKSTIGSYNYIHIASHGFSNDLAPELSGIVFAKNQLQSDTIHGTNDDGILYANEMFNLDLNARLVVLSTCESGIGKMVMGEGLMALTRGLLYSKVPNIIYSLWKVGDKNTQVLMLHFYKELFSGSSYAEALRFSKLKMIEDQQTAYPKYWAGFALIGN